MIFSKRKIPSNSRGFLVFSYKNYNIHFMELWFIYAIIASISIGINGYLIKLLADRKTDGAIVTFFQWLTYLLLWWIGNSVFGYSWFEMENMIVILFSLSIAIIIFLNLRIRVQALRYLSSSEYYIGYRIFTTIGLIVVGIAFFHESISLSQFFWLFLGSIAIALLLEEDRGLRHSRSWKKACMLLIVSVIAGVVIQIIGKIQWISSLPIPTMLFYQWIMMMLISSVFDRKKITVFFHWKKNDILLTLVILIPATICVYIAAVYNLLAYSEWGNVSVVTKILAYSLFVPIILSIVFSQEKIGYKKTIAFFLTIVSLYYML